MGKMKVTVYSPESVLRHPTRFLGQIAEDLSRSNALGWRLAVRDLRAQYSQAALGFFWALILPLGNTAAWLLMRNAGIVNISDTGIPYALYVFVGTMLWGIFVDAMNAPVIQATAARPMLTKVSFPPEALIISGCYQAAVHAGIKTALIYIAILAYDPTPGAAILLLPLGVASLMLAGTTFGLLVTPIGLLYTDVAKSLPLISQFLMYLTPVVFMTPHSGIVASLMQLNPITPLISTTRDWASGYEASALLNFIAVDVFMICTLLAVWIAYKAAMPILIERMSA